MVWVSPLPPNSWLLSALRLAVLLAIELVNVGSFDIKTLNFFSTKKDPPEGEPLFKRETRCFKNGAENRIRTDDLRITNALLYQLSYPGKLQINRR